MHRLFAKADRLLGEDIGAATLGRATLRPSRLRPGTARTEPRPLFRERRISPRVRYNCRSDLLRYVHPKDKQSVVLMRNRERAMKSVCALADPQKCDAYATALRAFALGVALE